MKKYEYQVTDVALFSGYKRCGAEQQHLTERGRDGWQLCAVCENPSTIHYYWKRELIKNPCLVGSEKYD